MPERAPLTILSAEDDHDDQLLIKEAFEKIEHPTELKFFDNGMELMRYLAGGQLESGLPALVLLDINMPIMNGWEVLEALKKGDVQMKGIPVAVFTTMGLSKDEISHCKKLGALDCVAKPSSFRGFVQVLSALVAKALRHNSEPA